MYFKEPKISLTKQKRHDIIKISNKNNMRKKIMKNKKQYETPIAESVFVDGLDILTESDNLTEWD